MNPFQGMIDAYSGQPRKVLSASGSYLPRQKSLDHKVSLLFKQCGNPLTIKAASLLINEDMERTKRSIIRLINRGLLVSCGRVTENQWVEVSSTVYLPIENANLRSLHKGAPTLKVYEFLSEFGQAPARVLSEKLDVDLGVIQALLCRGCGVYFSKAAKKIPVGGFKNVSACIYKIKE